MPARELPDRPNLDQYKKQAKDLLKSIRADDGDALDRLYRVHPRWNRVPPAGIDRTAVTLADAQLVIAREHGIDSWPKFAERIDAVLGERSPKAVWRRVDHAVHAGDAEALERLIREHGPMLRQPPRESWVGDLRLDGLGNRGEADALLDARSIIAAKLHFDSWERYAAFVETVRDRESVVAQFETAVDAIVAGDADSLARLLRARPELIRARSVRTHHSTLLLYVGANGVEQYRQRTPKNAPQIAAMLLDAGADVDAVGDMYRGTTTLGLVATSVHPVRTGVQEALIDLLLARGASLDRAVAPDYTHGRLVNACLANGRGEGARLVAGRGARLNLEGAAGVGHLDLVKTFFTDEGRLTAGATPDEMKSGFKWACGYGHIDVVRFLVERNVDVAERHRGETGLHLAAYGGHADIVAVLLEHGAPVTAEDEVWANTPLGWALYAWANPPDAANPDRYFAVVDLLIAAGARVDPAWLDDEQVSGDARMLAALGRARSE
jgi:hypothetical protein